MKATKRSLIVSIAILCVCALSLTSASFAWFTASETAKVDNVKLKVQAQSDIKIAADSAATSKTDSDLWQSILYQSSFTQQGNTIEEDIFDMTPALNGAPDASGLCTGNFVEPADREKVEAVSGDYTGSTWDTADGYSSFTVYVRATEQKDIVMNFSGFSYDGTGNSAVEALRLGVIGKGEGDNRVDFIANDAHSDVIISSDALTAFSTADPSQGFYSQVTIYVWVEGTDPACIDANALSLKNYDFNVSFEYLDDGAGA